MPTPHHPCSQRAQPTQPTQPAQHALPGRHPSGTRRSGRTAPLTAALLLTCAAVVSALLVPVAGATAAPIAPALTAPTVAVTTAARAAGAARVVKTARVNTTAKAPKRVKVRWAKVPGATTYMVRWSTTKKMKRARTVTAKGTSKVLRGLRPGTAYWVQVKAVPTTVTKRNAAVRIRWSRKVKARTPAARKVRLKAPAKVRTPNRSDTTMTVRWAKVPGAGAYKVRWSANKKMKNATTTRVTKKKVTLANLQPKTAYWVQVLAQPKAAAKKRSGKRPSTWSSKHRAATAKAQCSAAIHNPGTPAVRTGEPYDLTVASFNIRAATIDKGTAEERWSHRRNAVANQLIGIATLTNRAAAAPDVIAATEANDTYKAFGGGCVNQVIDLRNLLTSKGKGRYEATDPVRSDSQGTRILFNTDRVRLVKKGAVMMDKRADRFPYMPWAIFEVRDGGQQFFFASVHLTSGGSTAKTLAIRNAQWATVLRTLTDRNITQGLPVVLGGDFNSNRIANKNDKTPGKVKNTTARTYLPKMWAAGVGDTLIANGRLDNIPVEQTRALEAVNHDCNSLNRFSRAQSCNEWGLIGQHIDYIFASNHLRVKKWEMVLNMDKAQRLQGTIPSDHNMLRAVIELPAVS